MRDLSSYFKNRTIDYLKLTEFGFVKKESVYFYERAICHERFKIRIEITEKKQISRIIDQSLDEEYFLVDIQNASGDFVGQIREEYENFLNHLVDQCSIFDSFKSSQAKKSLIISKINTAMVWNIFGKNHRIMRFGEIRSIGNGMVF